MSTAKNLRVIATNKKSKHAHYESGYIPSALENQHNKLVADARQTRKNLRRESALLRKTALPNMMVSVVNMVLWIFLASYAREILGVACMIVCGVIGVACVFYSLLVSVVMASVSYTMEDEAKRLSKEV